MGYGDRLASGGRSATFPSASKKMTQEQWDEMWESEKDSEKESVNGEQLQCQPPLYNKCIPKL